MTMWWHLSRITVVSPARSGHRALCAVLWLITALLALGALVMIVSPAGYLALFGIASPSLLTATLRETGGLALGLAWLGWRAARDPVANVAVIDGFIVMMAALTVTPFITWLADPNLSYLHPFENPLWLVARSAVRLALAVLLYRLRPR